jgi:hypothetical protein
MTGRRSRDLETTRKVVSICIWVARNNELRIRMLAGHGQLRLRSLSLSLGTFPGTRGTDAEVKAMV